MSNARLKQPIIAAIIGAKHKKVDPPAEGASILDLIVRVPSTGEQRPLSTLSPEECNDLLNSKLGHTAVATAKAIFKSNFKKGPLKSAEVRRLATTENRREWQALALQLWTDEFRNDPRQSSRKEMAGRIADTIPRPKRPAIGTIENAIKRVKARAKRAAKARA